MIKYRIYPSLLDAYADYRNAAEIWETYWGSSATPSKSLEDYCEEQYQSLIDRINRVPFDSEAADRGTALNGLIDYMVTRRTNVEITPWMKDEDVLGYQVGYNNRTFYFPQEMVTELSRYYDGCIAQVFVSGVFPTMHGEVELYGFADYVGMDCVYDLKTTSRYNVGKYAEHWQRVVYPLCLEQKGCGIRDFEYNVVEIGKSSWATYTEGYKVRENDRARLTAFLEDFIMFLETNREKITDKKIFNEK